MSYMVLGDVVAKKKTISINPANAGKLRKTAKTKKGQKISLGTLKTLANSKSATTRRRAQFAINARKFKHK